MVRRLVAAGVGIVVLLLVVLLFRGCLSSRKENAMREYVQDVSGLVRESDQESKNLFRTLSAPADAQDVEIQNRLNTLRAQGEQILDRTEALDTPDELKGAQSYLTEVLKFRRDGVTAIARDLPRASADQGDRKQGVEQVAASMQNFLASDVIYQTRFAPVAARRARRRGPGRRADPAQPLPARARLGPARHRRRPDPQARRQRRQRQGGRAGPARHRRRLGHARRPDPEPRRPGREHPRSPTT